MWTLPPLYQQQDAGYPTSLCIEADMTVFPVFSAQHTNFLSPLCSIRPSVRDQTPRYQNLFGEPSVLDLGYRTSIDRLKPPPPFHLESCAYPEVQPKDGGFQRLTVFDLGLSHSSADHNGCFSSRSYGAGLLFTQHN